MVKALISSEIFGIGKTAPCNSPLCWVKNTFSAEKSRGEGITRRERGVRYWNVRVWGGRPRAFGPKTAEKWKMGWKFWWFCGFVVLRDVKRRNFWVDRNCHFLAPFELKFCMRGFLDLEISNLGSVRPDFFLFFFRYMFFPEFSLHTYTELTN